MLFWLRKTFFFLKIYLFRIFCVNLRFDIPFKLPILDRRDGINQKKYE